MKRRRALVFLLVFFLATIFSAFAPFVRKHVQALVNEAGLPLGLFIFILALIFSLLMIYTVPKWQIRRVRFPKTHERLKVENELRRTAVEVAGGAVVLVSLVITYSQYRSTQDLERQRQLTDQFSRAIEQLGRADKVETRLESSKNATPGGASKSAPSSQTGAQPRSGVTENNLPVRLGGIYALGRIAREFPDDLPVMNVLATFVVVSTRDIPVGGLKVDDANVSIPPPRPDVQGAIDVIGRRQLSREAAPAVLSLPGSVLRNLTATSLNLSYVDFTESYLEFSDFVKATMDETNFTRAHLEYASFVQAKLNRAKFQNAYLTAARFNQAQLQGASFAGALMEGVILTDARLEGAKLELAVRLSEGAIVNACTDQKTTLPPGVLPGRLCPER